MIPYANSDAVMLCSALTGKMNVQEIINKKVKTDGRLALTQSGAKLTGNGTCAILTAAASGSPQPCQCKSSCTLTGWSIVSNNQACGSSLLLQTSVNQCTVGGIITICSTGQHKVNQGEHIPVSSVETLSSAVVTSIAREEIRGDNEKRFSYSSQENTEQNSPKGSAVPKTDQSYDGPLPSDKSQTSDMSFIPRTGLLCSCNATNPDAKCFNCEYRLDRRISPVVANDSQTLRRNYDKARAQHDQYDRYFDKLFGFYASDEDRRKATGVKRGWSTVAHHIISGKQVLEEFPRIVKLARFCGYDVDNDSSSTHGINHYPNCIMLVGRPADYGKLSDGSIPQERQTQDFIKSVDADDVMSESLVQWHVGSHQYRFSKDEKKKLRRSQQAKQEQQAAGIVFQTNMQTVLGKRKDFRDQILTITCYAELMKARLQELEDEVKANPVCYKDEHARQDFIHHMECISREVKTRLAAFHEKPHRSYPYFVSLEAYLYAFAVPRTAHVVLVQRYRQGLRFSPWRITRYADTLRDNTKSLSFESEGENTDLYKLRYDGSSDKDVLDCLNTVCRSSRCFLLTDGLLPIDIPFLSNSVDNFFQLPVKSERISDEDFLQMYDSDIAAWLRRAAKNLAQQGSELGDKGVRDIRWSEWKMHTQEGSENT